MWAHPSVVCGWWGRVSLLPAGTVQKALERRRVATTFKGCNGLLFTPGRCSEGPTWVCGAPCWGCPGKGPAPVPGQPERGVAPPAPPGRRVPVCGAGARQISQWAERVFGALWRCLDGPLQAGSESSKTAKLLKEHQKKKKRESRVCLGTQLVGREPAVGSAGARTWKVPGLGPAYHGVSTGAVLATRPGTPCSPKMILTVSFTEKQAEPKYEKCWGANNEVNTAWYVKTSHRLGVFSLLLCPGGKGHRSLAQSLPCSARGMGGQRLTRLLLNKQNGVRKLNCAEVQLLPALTRGKRHSSAVTESAGCRRVFLTRNLCARSDAA